MQSGVAHVTKDVAFVTNAAFGFYAERLARKIRDSLPPQSPTIGGSDASRGLNQGGELS